MFRHIAIAANATIRILFAPLCPGCRNTLDTPLTRSICDECLSNVRQPESICCRTCGDGLTGIRALYIDDPRCERCVKQPPAFREARSAGIYDGPLREIVHAFKYERRRQLAIPLGQLLRQTAADWLNEADAAVPVPLHVFRSARRGFNQADDLARELDLPVWRALRRRRHGPSQTALSANIRRRNLRKDFDISLQTAVFKSTRRRLSGACVLLVDDVMTTGTTLDACAHALREAGVADVRALTVARAVASRPPQQPEPPRPSLLPR